MQRLFVTRQTAIGGLEAILSILPSRLPTAFRRFSYVGDPVLINLGNHIRASFVISHAWKTFSYSLTRPPTGHWTGRVHPKIPTLKVVARAPTPLFSTPTGRFGAYHLVKSLRYTIADPFKGAAAKPAGAGPCDPSELHPSTVCKRHFIHRVLPDP